MLSNPMNNWYTDLADVYRSVDTVVNGFDENHYVLMRSEMPCRVFSSSNPQTKMTTTYSSVQPTDKLACHTKEDIKAGDKIIVTRGARVGGSGKTTYIAGEPTDYYEPYGGARPRIDHKEVPIGGERKVDEGGIPDGLRERNQNENGNLAPDGSQPSRNINTEPTSGNYQGGGSSNQFNPAK